MAASPIDAARDLAPRIRARADAIEAERRLPVDLVAALAAAGIFRMGVPRELGGTELEPVAMLAVFEEIAHADGSAGWCAMIGATSGLVSGYLPIEFAREIYADPTLVTGGVFAPTGRAVAVDGGYDVTGRWAFASGSEHCAWLMGGCVVTENGAPRLLASGAPDTRMMLFPAGEVEVIDTWTASGLRGTGSHDIRVARTFVPAGRSVSLITDSPRASGTLYRFPVFGLLALGIAAVALGIARRAIDELVELARAKTPTASRRRLGERAAVQIDISGAEAAVRAARAFLVGEVERAWAVAERGAIGLEQRTLLRLAATHATTSAARAVDAMYNAGGGTSVYATSPLQRCFRDVHVATQHMMVAPATYELVGRLLVGLETDTALL